MRIRSIKPEFWRSASVAELSREVRLLWIGLWSYVDDNGVGLDDYRQIAADLFPLDDDPSEAREFVREGLATLSRVSRITRYEVDGRPLVYVNGFDEHQRVDKPNQPRYPLPTDDGASVCSDDGDSREGLANNSRESREGLAPGAGDQGSRGAGETPCGPPSGDERTRPRSRSSTPNRFDEFWEIYPKRVGKQAAIKAWRKAIKKADVDTILDGVRRYADERFGDDPQFTAHPATWLNQGRWDDEPQPKPKRHLRAVEHHGWRNPDQSEYDEPLLPPLESPGEAG